MVAITTNEASDSDDDDDVNLLFLFSPISLFSILFHLLHKRYAVQLIIRNSNLSVSIRSSNLNSWLDVVALLEYNL